MLGSRYIYEFGDAIVTTLDIDVEFSKLETTNELWSKMNDYFDEVPLDRVVVKLQRLSREKEEIDKILASSIPLIEPSLSSELMKLQELLSGAISYEGALHLDEKLQPTGFEMAVFMYKVAASAQKAKTWVLSKATNKKSNDEFILELAEMAQKQEDSRSKNG